MPFINLDLIDEVIGNKERQRVEFAYLILNDVSQISWIGQDENDREIIGETKIQNSK